MRALARACAAAAVLLAPACAHIEAPTGGPVDSIAPTLVTTRPDTNAVLTEWRGPAIFVFDEGLSEEGVDEAVTLSPRRGPVAVDKEGDEIRVQPRRGWQPGTIYQVEVAAGLKDRFGNAIRTPSRLVFSTGPAIPATRATGLVTDRITGTPLLQARVDALRLADSLLYSTVTDSAGRYTFSQVPEGEYRLIGYRDTNRNFRVDAFEQRDTAVLTFVTGQAPSADLVLLPNDTTAPVAGSARMTDGWVEVRFDDYLDPEQSLSPEQVALIGPDGAAVAITAVRVGAPPAARDSGAAPADSARPEAQRPPAQRPARDTARADTAGADTAGPRGPLPSQSLFARPAAALLPDTIYTVRVRDVRNVNGLVGGGEVPLRTPEPAPPPRPQAPAADSAAVPADSAAADSVPPAPPPAVTPPVAHGGGVPDPPARRRDARAAVVPRGWDQAG